MKLVFKLSLIFVGALLFFSTGYAKTCGPTTIVFQTNGWDGTIPSGQTAKFATDSSPQELHIDFNQSSSNQSKSSHACFGERELGGTYIVGTIYSPSSTTKVYTSINTYDSSKTAHTLYFPSDFRQIQK